MVQRSIRATTFRRLGRGQLNGQRSSLSRQTRSNSNRYFLETLILKDNHIFYFNLKNLNEQTKVGPIQKVVVVPVRRTLHSAIWYPNNERPMHHLVHLPMKIETH